MHSAYNFYMVSELCYRFSTWNESMNFWVASLRRISEIFGEIFSEKNSIFGFLAKKYPNWKKKNRSNRSSDEGDIVDLKSALFVRKFCDGRTIAMCASQESTCTEVHDA